MKLTVDIEDQRIADLLVGAFEGGSNYWYVIDSYVLPEGVSFEDFGENRKYQRFNMYYNPYEIIPLFEGCEVLVTDKFIEKSPEKFSLNRKTIEQGLHTMATKYPWHFGNFLSENDDATTADVFLQCCLFGEIRYA